MTGRFLYGVLVLLVGAALAKFYQLEIGIALVGFGAGMMTYAAGEMIRRDLRR